MTNQTININSQIGNDNNSDTKQKITCMISNFYSFIHTLVLHILDLRLKFVHQGHKGQGQDVHFTPLCDVHKLVMRNVVSVEQIPAKTNSLKEIWVYDLETCLSRS